MTIHLKPEQERLVREQIRSGFFRSPEEVIEHALAALREKEEKTSATAEPRKNIVDVLTRPPFAGSNLELERLRDYPKPLNL